MLGRLERRNLWKDRFDQVVAAVAARRVARASLGMVLHIETTFPDLCSRGETMRSLREPEGVLTSSAGAELPRDNVLRMDQNFHG